MEKIILVQNNIRSRISDIENNPALKKDKLKQILFSEMCQYFDSLCEITTHYEKETV